MIPHDANNYGTGGKVRELVATLDFQVISAFGFSDETRFEMIIEENSDSIAGAAGGKFLGTVTLIDATINPVPAPGTALLMSLGLLGLGVVGRRNR